MNLRNAALAGAILLLATSGCENRLDPVSVRNIPGTDAPGAESGGAGVAMARTRVLPTIQITSPRPSALIMPVVTPTVSVSWNASDLDAPHGLPREIRYKLFSESQDNALFLTFLVNPDSLRRLYAPDFPGWTVLPGNATGVTLSGLTVFDRYLLVVTAFDRQGRFDPVFSLNQNMLVMLVGPAGQAAARTTPGPTAPSRR